MKTHILRFVAFLGVLIVSIKYAFFSLEIQPRQDYSYFVFGLLTCAVGFALLTLFSSTEKLLRNLDLLVPLGFYLTATEITSLFFYRFIYFDFLRPNFGINPASITTNFILAIIGYIIFSTIFTGWTTRLILQLIRTGKVDLIEAFSGIKYWFLRTFIVVSIFQTLTILLFLPILFTLELAFVLLFFATPIWNLVTFAVLPTVLSNNESLFKAILNGIKISAKHLGKAFGVIMLHLVIGGYVVFIFVYPPAIQNPKAEFGSYEKHLTGIEGKSFAQVSMPWLGGYLIENKWNRATMKTVQAQPFPSTDFRITILMLILAIVIKIKLTEIIFRNKENSFSEIDVFLRNKKANQFWVFPLALSVVCLFPFEFLTKYLVHKPKETEYLASEFKFSKVYQGDNFFSKTDFINLEENRLQIKFISDFTFFEKTGEFIISGTREAVVLDENRQFKEKIQFKLGKSEDKNYPEAHFQKVKPIDIENDGIAEFIGVGSYPYNGFILNHQGEIIWRYSEVQDTISLESVEIKDIDGDKLPEIVVIEKGTRNEKGEKFGIIKSFDLKTKKEKWSQTINNGFFSQDVDLIDIDLDGKDEIVTWATKNQNNNGSILNQKGEEIQKIKIPYKNNGFLIEKDEKPQILFFAENKLGLFDFNGNLNAKYETPFSEIENKNIFREERDLYLKLVSVYQANAIKIKLKIDQLKFLAVLANISTRLSDENVDMMYVYDSQGNLVYQESIKGQCTIEKLRNENGTESLILVENEKIKFYKAN